MKEKNLYQVGLSVKYTTVSEWLQETVNVVANGDAEKAIRKAKRHVLGMEFDNDGVTAKAVKAKLVTIEKLNSVDVI